MAPRFTYTAPGDWSEVLATNVRLGTLGLVSRAEMGDVGISSIVLDNPDGTLGHASDDIVGFKQFLVDELDEDAGDQRVYSSFIGRRQYRRGQDKALRQGIGHEVEATLSDRNWLLTLSIVTGTDGVRPAETVTARVAWLLGSTYLATVVDIGYVDSTLTTAMSAVDYRGQKPIDVLGDCANQAKVNFWVGYDEYADVDWLWFADSNTSLLYDSGCFISDDPADIDLAAIRAGTASVFAGTPADTLDRDPERVFSGQYRPYAKGNVYVTDGAIATAFIARDGSAPDANIKTEAVANAVATADLHANDEEDDRITRTILVNAKQANAIKHGQLVQIRSTWMPAYSTWRQMRVLTKTLTQLPSGNRSLYTMTLELSPATLPCGDLVQIKSSGILEGANLPSFGCHLAFDTPPTVGNTMIAFVYFAGTGGPIDNWGPQTWTQDLTTGAFDSGTYVVGIEVRRKLVEPGDTGLDIFTADPLTNTYIVHLAEILGNVTIAQAPFLASFGTTIDVPGITTTEDSLLFGLHTRVTSAAPHNNPGGWTQLLRQEEPLGDRQLVQTFSQSFPAGTIAPTSFSGGVESADVAAFAIIEIDCS